MTVVSSLSATNVLTVTKHWRTDISSKPGGKRGVNGGGGALDKDLQLWERLEKAFGFSSFPFSLL